MLRAPGPGSYFIEAEALGYARHLDGTLDLQDGGYIDIAFYLRPAPIPTRGLTAIAQRQHIDEKLIARGFYERKARGFGHFVGPQELESRLPHDSRDLLRGIPGINVIDNGFAGQSVRCRNQNSPSQGTAPTVYVDGILMDFPDLLATEGTDVDLSVIGIEAIAGLEVFTRGSQVPLQYGGLGSTCVILVWTKS